MKGLRPWTVVLYSDGDVAQTCLFIIIIQHVGLFTSLNLKLVSLPRDNYKGSNYSQFAMKISDHVDQSMHHYVASYRTKRAALSNRLV